jgi:hypothetical protein
LNSVLYFCVLIQNLHEPITELLQTKSGGNIADMWDRCVYERYSAAQDSMVSSVGIATGYRLESRDSIPNMDKGLFSSPDYPDWLWGPPSLMYQENHGLFPLR